MSSPEAIRETSLGPKRKWFLPSATVLQKGNVFTSIDTPLGRHPLADTPWQTPPGQTPPGQTPPGQTTPLQTPWADTRPRTDTPISRHPLRRPLQWTVRILLECILAYNKSLLFQHKYWCQKIHLRSIHNCGKNGYFVSLVALVINGCL